MPGPKQLAIAIDVAVAVIRQSCPVISVLQSKTKQNKQTNKQTKNIVLPSG